MSEFARSRRLLPIACLLAASAHPVCAADVDFSRDIRPILSDACFACHGPDEKAREAELRFDVQDGISKARDEGLLGNDPTDSELIRRVTSDDPDERMPPPESNLSLTPQQIDLLKQWIAEGADGGSHWAYVPPVRQTPLAVSQSRWTCNAIDRFILARLEAEGLSPSPEAERTRLLRRVTLDLTGVPPTIAEIDAFIADDSPDAYERVVDRLLASARYGERMAWEWMDAARYADTSGFQGDPERTMWPWRDWLIGALNAGMTFDQFTVEQLAGDLLPNATIDQRIATGFCRNNMHNGEGGRIPEETRVENVFDRVETLATVWLGATLTCARCHDHKYDPFTQQEYYQLYAFFNSTTEEGGNFRGGRIPPTMQLPTDDETAELAKLDDSLQEQTTKLAEWEQAHGEELLPPAEAEQTEDPTPVTPDNVREALGKPVNERSNEQLQAIIDHYKESQAEFVQQLTSFKETRDRRNQVNDRIVQVMVMDTRDEPRDTFILDRGTYNKPGEQVAAAVPASLPSLPEDQPTNRLTLAQWLVDPQHPLTARVTVNREWQRFFGKGLVGTVEDFGSQGDLPTHPVLLDWLATELIRTDWDIKRLQRLIVTSATYRQSSRVSPELAERDPGNQLLARGPRYRMPSWMLRDQALAISGLLNDSQGGPSVKPYQPAGLWAEATFGKKQYDQDHGAALYRRSLYTYWRRIVGPPLFFDTAKRQTCEVNAVRTNTPLHALTTMNDITFVEAARAMAQRVLLEAGEADELAVTLAFRLATSRPPTDEELTVLTTRLQTLREQYVSNPDSSNELLAVGESPRDESLNITDHAAMTSLCLLILNLDETLTKE
ncbi:MAG: PSD1 and planctomycete cytochrome C domain-containing protein [Planctomycetaceae bacterium]